VNPDEIKSPLPPRKVLIGDEGEVTPIPEAAVPPTEPTGGESVLFPPQGPTVTGEGNSSRVSSKIIQKKPFNKKIIFIAIGVAVLGLVIMMLPKIFSGKTDGNKEVTLNYWGIWEESSVIDAVIADFEAQNPGIKIKYTRKDKENYRSILMSRLQKGQEDTPDIFRIHSTWVPTFQNLLEPVPQTTATNLQLESDFFDVYKTELKKKGAYLAIPLMYDGLALFYNKTMLDAAAVSVPKGWWELQSAAEKMTVRDSNGKLQVAGAAIGLTDNIDHWSDVVGLLMKQNGVNPLVDDEENNQKIQSVLEYYTLFATKNGGVWDQSMPNSTDAFTAGKVAFYFGPLWRVYNFAEPMYKDFKYEVTTVPQLPTIADIPLDQPLSDADLTNIHWASYWVEGVAAGSKHQKEAWKFMEFLASKESLEKMYTAASQIRVFGELYPRKSMAEMISSNEKIRPFISVADNASGWYLASRTFDAGLNEEMIKYFGDAVNQIITTKDIKNAMITLRSGINQLKSRYKLTE
jgi:multiple sugar transport system substrate-binding protein